jgi:hypothetical protein
MLRMGQFATFLFHTAGVTNFITAGQVHIKKWCHSRQNKLPEFI